MPEHNSYISSHHAIPLLPRWKMYLHKYNYSIKVEHKHEFMIDLRVSVAITHFITLFNYNIETLIDLSNFKAKGLSIA